MRRFATERQSPGLGINDPQGVLEWPCFALIALRISSLVLGFMTQACGEQLVRMPK
jgi:hypothetical protein